MKRHNELIHLSIKFCLAIVLLASSSQLLGAESGANADGAILGQNLAKHKAPWGLR